MFKLAQSRQTELRNTPVEGDAMKHVNLGVLVLFVAAVSLAHGQAAAQSIPVSVDCSAGQSLNRTLSRLYQNTSYTVSVKGTCAEYVHVIGFHNLTLKGLPGAQLVKPSAAPGNLANAVLFIEASQSVTVQGFSIQADTTVSAVDIGHGSTDIRLRNLNITGGSTGIAVFENSQVSLAYVTAQDPGYATLGIYDSSDVHVEHCAFQDSTGALWHVGIALGASHITMYATTIGNMQVGIDAESGSIVDVLSYNTYYPLIGSTDVTITNSAGTSYNGVTVNDGSQLNVLTAKLVINQPGQSWGGTTGGVLVSNGSGLYAPSGNLAIAGSNGDGILVLNNSHALVGAFTVTGSVHGGLVAANLSTIDVDASTALSIVGGNAVDLFCDSQSAITGSANIAGVPTAQCANLLATETAPLP
jgi:hypothetical protein